MLSSNFIVVRILPGAELDRVDDSWAEWPSLSMKSVFTCIDEMKYSSQTLHLRSRRKWNIFPPEFALRLLFHCWKPSWWMSCDAWCLSWWAGTRHAECSGLFCLLRQCSEITIITYFGCFLCPCGAAKSTLKSNLDLYYTHWSLRYTCWTAREDI